MVWLVPAGFGFNGVACGVVLLACWFVCWQMVWMVWIL